MGDAAIAGLLGTLFGFLVKWFLDLLTERLRQARQDLVWRRERLVDAGADFLRVTADLRKATAGVSDSVEEFQAARDARDSKYVEAARQGLDEAHAERRPLLLEADRSIEVLRLFTSERLDEAATEYHNLCKTSRHQGGGDSAATLESQKVLVRLLRAETGSASARPGS